MRIVKKNEVENQINLIIKANKDEVIISKDDNIKTITFHLSAWSFFPDEVYEIVTYLDFISLVDQQQSIQTQKFYSYKFDKNGFSSEQGEKFEVVIPPSDKELGITSGVIGGHKIDFQMPFIEGKYEFRAMLKLENGEEKYLSICPFNVVKR